VSGALSASSSVEFPDALAAQNAQKQVSEADLENDMTALADTQLRYEADAKLLKAAYARLRSALRG
jgi:flagellar basal body rod protein FlgB